MTALPWRVLLICGSSGTGKTTVARALARRLGLSVLLADDLRLALQQVTSPDQLPDLHVFRTDHEAAALTPEGLRDGLIRVAQALRPALKMVIAHHVVVEGVGPLVVEGDGVLPDLAAPQAYAELIHFWGLRTTSEVRAVVLVEEDEARLLAGMVQRGRGFDELAEQEQRRIARSSWLYGRWLQEQARQVGVPVLPARPYETLLERVEALVMA